MSLDLSFYQIVIGVNTHRLSLSSLSRGLKTDRLNRYFKIKVVLRTECFTRIKYNRSSHISYN